MSFEKWLSPPAPPALQAYMKSKMPFLGVAATPIRKVCRAVFSETPFETQKNIGE